MANGMREGTTKGVDEPLVNTCQTWTSYGHQLLICIRCALDNAPNEIMAVNNGFTNIDDKKRPSKNGAETDNCSKIATKRFCECFESGQENRKEF